VGIIASGLLRFSLMRDDPAAEVRSHGLTGMRSLNSRKGRWSIAAGWGARQFVWQHGTIVEIAWKTPGD